MTTQEILESLKLEKGQPAMTAGQLQRRIKAYTESLWPWAERERDPAGYADWKDGMLPTLAAAEEAFAFNYKLAAYKTATARLTQHVLADGRAEIWEDQPTGGLDPETGEAITESVMVSAAIEPLEAEVEQEIRDPETGEVTGTEMVPNPLIETDTAERSAAQVVVDNTPADVIAYSE